MAEDELRSEECPHCGVHARDFMEYETKKVKCPVCQTEYDRTVRRKSEIEEGLLGAR